LLRPETVPLLLRVFVRHETVPPLLPLLVRHVRGALLLRVLAELELELVQAHVTQKPMLRVEVGAVSCSRCACVAHKGHARENRGGGTS
jgi:hypothetical protein